MSSEDLLLSSVKAVFGHWTGLQLAIVHNFGGSNTKEKAEWFANATHEWIRDTNDLDEYDLEDFFDDTMSNEFNSLLEDGSSLGVSRSLLALVKLWRAGQTTQLQEELQRRFPKRASEATVAASLKTKTTDDQDTSSDESGDDAEDDGGDVADAATPRRETQAEQSHQPMDGMESPGETDRNNNPKPLLNEKETESFEKVEEGWTFVTKSGKRLTK